MSSGNSNSNTNKENSIAFWELGFRPFFLFGSLSGAATLCLWVAVFGGYTNFSHIDMFWHAHEMIHGFVSAIIIGFLFTASQNWTGLPGIRGKRLAFVFVVWLLGRLALLVPVLTSQATALIDLAFLPIASSFLSAYLFRAGQSRNLIFLVFLAVLWSANICYHGERLGLVQGVIRQSLYVSVYIVACMIIIISSRVIPFFSERAIQGNKRKENKFLDRTCILSAVIFTLLMTLPVTQTLRFFSSSIVALLLAIRLWLWFVKDVWRIPILLVLYIGYAWLIIGYIFAAMALLGKTPETTAVHAFTVGSISIMIIGMMSRVSLGHTGRLITASQFTVVAYGLITLSAIIRVFGAIMVPSHYLVVVTCSGTFWVLAMIVFIGVYWRILINPRI